MAIHVVGRATNALILGLGGDPPDVLADAGYRGEATFQTLEARGITAYISLGHEVRPAKPPNPAHVATQRMAARLASDTGRARSRRRKAIVEPVLGWIKEVLGFRRFSLRGLAKVRGEWNVTCLAVNLKRLTSAGNRLNDLARVRGRLPVPDLLALFDDSGLHHAVVVARKNRVAVTTCLPRALLDNME